MISPCGRIVSACRPSSATRYLGIAGAIVVLLAFYLPSCAQVFAVGKFWDHFEGSPWRDSVQRGMAPITIGSMASGVYAIGRTATINLDRSMRFNATTVVITLVVTVILLKRHINPALLILVGGPWDGSRCDGLKTLMTSTCVQALVGSS